ncbi:MAG TPA: hypothetical protein VFJ90_05625 [Candidatus Didemnitutus sp.]|nr:hypothetical protein [Candidatus Didemnitutus sp.]
MTVTAFVPVPLALVAFMVTLVVAAVVGVPETSPVLLLTLNPAGNPVAEKLVGVLLAVIW